jgi:NTE family protein
VELLILLVSIHIYVAGGKDMKRPRIGLALGAGAARGFAHVGVLQVLIQSGVPIDYIAGCSMGAFIGALYATGSDMFFFEKLIPQLDIKNLLDFSIPRHGLIRGEKMRDIIKLLTKNRSFEETDIPFRCVAVDICGSCLEVFSEGPLYEAIRASISIPGFFVPYKYNGKVYVDGAVMERLPVQTARDMGADVVIGVDVSFKGETQKAPGGVMELMAQVMNVMGWEIAKNKIYDADILILPDVRKINAFSSEDALECIELGREAAKNALPEIRKQLIFLESSETAKIQAKDA